MHKPLEGIRILEWGIFHAGPGGPAILADMGAEVIKIEQPGNGDPMRRMTRYKGIDFSIGEGRNLFYEGANRGKKSITLNLSHEEGRKIAHDLVGKSDVFLTNLRASSVKKADMDYPTLSGINPRLIYASVTSYGRKGPEADEPGFDYQGQGKSGFMYCSGGPDSRPYVTQFGIIDQTTAIMASYQIVLALLMRERFGIGQEVDVSLVGTAACMMYLNYLTALLTGIEVPRHDQATADSLRNHYRCQDGRWIVQTQSPGEDNWELVCDAMGLPELAEDPRYDSREKRLERSPEIVAIFNRVFETRPSHEWVTRYRKRGLVICAVNTVQQAVHDPQMIENGYVTDFEHPEMGKIRIPCFPIRLSRAEIRNTIVAPRLGEHTDEVLKELCGYDDERIARLREEKVI